MCNNCSGENSQKKLSDQQNIIIIRVAVQSSYNIQRLEITEYILNSSKRVIKLLQEGNNTMRMKIVFIMLMLLSLCLTGCRKSNLAVMSDEKSVTIIAENASKDMFGATSGFEITEGEKLYIDPVLNKGEISVKLKSVDPRIDAVVEELKDAVNGENPDLEIKISGTASLEYELDPGSYSIYATVLSRADGTIVMSIR